MLPANLSNTNHIKVAALLGLISAFLIFISMFIPIHLPLFFSGLPILIAYMAYDKHCGTITFLFISLVLFLAFPMEFFLDVFLDIIAPAALLGYLSIKNIEQNNKIWWYPESLLLRN
ncbi:MAG: hypothetical protein LBF44_02005, partial [Holosporaceae bacterium]|nr:hypothetical protein [Holosporaceae bacterium]